MNGLFSNNPEMTRAMNYGTNLANVPAGRVALALSPVMGQMAQQATGGLLSGLGVESPEVKKERALQGILGGINPQDANSLADASRKLMGMGLQTEAAKLMEQAQQVAKNTAEVGKLNAEAGKAESWLGNEEAKRALEERYREADRVLKEKLANTDDDRQASLVQAQINKLNKEAELAGVKVAAGGFAPSRSGAAGGVDFKKAMGLTAETLNNLNGNPQASSYLMGAQQLFSEGKQDEAMNLVNYAKQAAQLAGDDTVAVKDDAIIRDVNKSTEKLNLQLLGLNQITTILNNPENFNNPKLMQTLASQLTSATSQTAIRALAEVEGLRNAEEFVATIQDFISKLGTGTITNESILKYKEAASELQKAVSENKAKVMSGKIEQYSKTGMLKSDAKVPSFLSGFGMSGATVVSDDSGGKPNGYYKKDKDGNIYVVVNGKVYKGRM